ncbi:MAG: AI-2E family transporter [Kiritimatiellia bacterium]|jgi:predicted PurR-regulated permease PerM|nr:AI-2E family transporter [Kiritimatiellia bacterium]
MCPPRNPSDPKAAIAFTERQQGIVAAGITVLCATLITGFAALLFWGVFALLSAVSVVLTPLLVAMILALLFKPYYQWLHTHLRRSHLLALPVLFLSILIPAGGLFFFFGSLLVSQLMALYDYLPALIERISDALTHGNPTLEAFITKFGLEEKIPLLNDPESFVASLFDRISLDGMSGMALAYGMDAIKYLVSLVGWLVVPVYLIYFLTAKPFSGRNAENFLPFLKPATRQDVSYLIDEFFAIIVAFFRGQVTVAFIQGILFGLGFWIVGLPYGLLIGLTLGLFNLVPYLGNIIGLAVTLPMSFFGEGGSGLRLGLVLAVFCAVQLLDGYLITPRIQGKKTGLSDPAIIFSLLFWGVVFKGILGVLLAIPLSAFIVVLWRLLKNKYIKELI